MNTNDILFAFEVKQNRRGRNNSVDIVHTYEEIASRLQEKLGIPITNEFKPPIDPYNSLL